MAKEVVALEFALDAGKANMTLGELEEGFEAMQKKLRKVGRGSEEFKTLTTSMAGTSAEIKNIELAFEGLDKEQVASELGSVAGGIGDVTASLVLMGGENETIEQMAASIETAMAISMGLKGAIEGLSSAKKLYTNLLEQGKLAQIKENIATTFATAKTWLLNTAKKAYAITTGVLTGQIKIATVAQKAFNAVMKANPIALLVTAILAAGAAYIAFAKDTSEAAKEQKALGDSLEAVKGEIASVYEEVNKMENAFALAKDGVISKEEALQTYNETIGQTIGQADSLEEAEQKFSDNTGAYIKAATLRAQAQQLIKMAAEEQTEALLAGEQDNRSFAESTVGAFGAARAALTDYTTLGLFSMTKSNKESVEKTKEAASERFKTEKASNAERYTELARSLEAEALLIESSNNFISDADKTEADKKAEAAKAASAARTAQREKDKAADEKAAADAIALAEKVAADEIALEIEKNKLLEDLEAKAIQDKNIRALAELEIAQERERAQLIEKFGKDTELMKALEIEQRLAMDEFIAEIEEAEKEKKIEEDLVEFESDVENLITKEQAFLNIELERIQKLKDARREAVEERMAQAEQVGAYLMNLNDLVRDGAINAHDAEYNNAKKNGNLTAKQEYAYALQKDAILKKHFERAKKMNIAMAIINTAQAVVSALANPYPLNIALAAASAISGGLQINAIQKQKFSGSAQMPPPPTAPVAPRGPDAGGGAVITPVSNTSTILGDQQVTVTETDITSTQNNVSVIEESATF